MKLKLFPALHIQRELLSQPRNLQRFHKYLMTISGGGEEIITPIVSLNPMGREHNITQIDALVAMDAEGVATRTLVEAEERLSDVALEFQVSLVVVDNLGGMWSNRTEGEYKLRVPGDYKKAKPSNKFFEFPCWVNEPWTPESLRRALLCAMYRVAYWWSGHHPKTLAEIMTQEMLSIKFAGPKALTLGAEDIAYSREVLAPHMAATAQEVLMPALFGDVAAHEFGYAPMGLSPRAGLEVALDDALHSDVSPEAAIKQGVAASETKG
jgi:hypothetical protein